ncbi:protein KASH5 isoform X1 [Turdus rufiventris]|nr:protein KASH5 isoform X1 [Turdus rufiventris]
MAAEGPSAAPGAVIPLPAPDESGCSDEFALDCTFAACDPEQTGLVQPQRVVEYVAAMTGHSGHDGRLRALQWALDPAAAGTALDRARFRTAMGAWIAACRQDGSTLGSVGLSSSAEAAGLRSRARQLAAQNTKLQRDAEQAEELNTRLAEEIAQLQAQLRSSRQALEQARLAIEELDDMKAMVKGLEEENTELRRQARHANQRLLTEGQGLREQIQAQAARMASLEAGQRAQELTAALEEYERMVQELRLETTRLRQQLGQLRDAWAMRPWCPRGQLAIQATAAASRAMGDKEEDEEEQDEEEEEDTGMALSGGGLARSSEEVAEVVTPQALLAPWALLSPWTPLSPWALALLVLLALLFLLPHQWPQPQLRYRSPPPL